MVLHLFCSLHSPSTWTLVFASELHARNWFFLSLMNSDFLLRTSDLSRFLGCGCDESLVSEKKKGSSVKREEAIQWIRGLVRIYSKGTSVKRFGPFTEPPDSENWKVALSSSPSRQAALTWRANERKSGNSNGGCSEGRALAIAESSSAIASEVSTSSKSSLAITDFLGGPA